MRIINNKLINKFCGDVVTYEHRDKEMKPNHYSIMPKQKYHQ